MVNEQRKGEEESHLLGQLFLFVGAHPFLYSRKLNIISDGDDRSDFVVKVYRKHSIRVRVDKVAGSLSDTIGRVLGRLKDGGTKAF